ncbi:MAG: hypothetical protein GQ578_05860 [Desulfuromonadaceae bacterium]|nr:hypothetical protein [Desulfuromonadaceae bacterium]
MADKSLNKQIGLKTFGKGKQSSDDQLAKINQLALEPLSADQVYVRRFLVAHNGLDRDRERFNDELLEQFAATLPGKGMFLDGHPSGWNGSGAPGSGRWFDAGTEFMSPAEFKQLTGEDLKLPDEINQVKVLWGESYLLKDISYIDEWTKLIDAGIVSFVSIGFNAPRKSITDDNGNYLYGEYYPNGEALEASLVWLGAQPGASAKFAKGNQPEQPNCEEEIRMKEFLKRLEKALGLKQALTEDNALDRIVAQVEEKDTQLEAKNQEITGLKAAAADGAAYRKSLVDDAIRFGTLIDEVPTDEAAQKSESEFLTSLPIERLKSMRDKYETRAREKCPTDPVFIGKDEGDRQQQNNAAQQKGKQSSGKKDFTSAADNELFATVGK